MKKPGRKSAAELTALAGVTAIPRRPGPPRGLSKAARELWTSIVAGYDPGHFQPQDLPMLASYVTHAVQLAALDARLAKSGLFVKGPRGALRLHPGVAARATLVKSLATLGAKLRLPVNARVRSDSGKSQPKARKKPWEA